MRRITIVLVASIGTFVPLEVVTRLLVDANVPTVAPDYVSTVTDHTPPGHVTYIGLRPVTVHITFLMYAMIAKKLQPAGLNIISTMPSTLR